MSFSYTFMDEAGADIDVRLNLIALTPKISDKVRLFCNVLVLWPLELSDMKSSIYDIMSA